MPTGSGLLQFFGIGFAQILRRFVSIRVKALSDTNLVASRRVKREKASLPFDLRGSKTLLRSLRRVENVPVDISVLKSQYCFVTSTNILVDQT